MTKLNHGYKSAIDQVLSCKEKDWLVDLDPVKLSTKEYDKIHGRKERSATQVQFESAFQPIINVGSIIGNTFRRYQHPWKIIEDIFLFLYGMKDLARGAITLPFALLSYPFLLTTGFFWSAGVLLCCGSIKNAREFLATTLSETTSTLIESLMLIDAGISQIVLWPFTLLRSIPRGIVTCCLGWPKTEDGDIVQANIKYVDDWKEKNINNQENNSHHQFNSKKMDLIARTLRAKLLSGKKKNQRTDIDIEDAITKYEIFRNNFKTDNAKAQQFFLEFCGLFSHKKDHPDSSNGLNNFNPQFSKS